MKKYKGSAVFWSEEGVWGVVKIQSVYMLKYECWVNFWGEHQPDKFRQWSKNSKEDHTALHVRAFPLPAPVS
jgi:hypothetical protein